jgi:hypothetical protein
MCDVNEALISYRANFTIRERLAGADPSNAGWQRDLAISFGKVALIYRALGMPAAEALAKFRNGRQIMAALVERAPDVMRWKKDLAWSDEQIAALERQMQTARE